MEASLKDILAHCSPYPWRTSNDEDVLYDANGEEVFNPFKSTEELLANQKLIQYAPTICSHYLRLLDKLSDKKE